MSVISLAGPDLQPPALLRTRKGCTVPG
ncbi:hypothetical protein [Sinorhizobium meliloti]|nr:hypothetical protein CN245_32050 [Sinorhizobium meliloti]